MAEWIDVTQASALLPGERVIIDLDDIRVAVFNLQGHFYAIHSECTHATFELDDAPLEGDAIVCPLHGARFCIKTGKVLCPPAFEPLKTFPVRVENGILQICDDRFG